MATIFLMCCLCIFGITSPNQESIIKYFASDINAKDNIVEVYGGSQFLLGKKCIEKYSIVKNSYGKLTKPYKEITRDASSANIEKIVPIINYCDEKAISYFYLTSLLPILEEELPYANVDHSHENASILQNVLEEQGTKLIDLRTSGITVPKEKQFYRTDHHWTTDTMFAAFQVVINHIKKIVNTEKKWMNPSCYETQNYANSFLGSYGIKVGKYYAGKDDFKVLIPKNAGEYCFEAYDSKGTKILEKNGPWFEAFMDKSILEDSSYNNKYNAWCNNQYVENRLINKEVDNRTKVLLIAHSYGRPLTQYLSLCYHEVRHLDPSKGRFSGNFFEYIDEYQPDIVLFLVEFEGDLIGEYNTER